MELDKIKDIIVTRWAFIASNAESIAHIARAMVEAERLDGGSINQIEDCLNDIDINLASIANMRDALTFVERAKDELHD